jgi:hypothetical protein
MSLGRVLRLKQQQQRQQQQQQHTDGGGTSSDEDGSCWSDSVTDSASDGESDNDKEEQLEDQQMTSESDEEQQQHQHEVDYLTKAPAKVATAAAAGPAATGVRDLPPSGKQQRTAAMAMAKAVSCGSPSSCSAVASLAYHQALFFCEQGSMVSGAASKVTTQNARCCIHFGWRVILLH